MLASHLDRAQRTDLARPPVAPAVRPRSRLVVAAFKQRVQAQRAIWALVRAGWRPDQIRLDGPTGRARARRWRAARTGWRSRPGAVIGGTLLGAALCRLVPPRGRGWVRGVVGVPALGLGFLGALAALANPDGIDVLPWRVTVASDDWPLNSGGILRAHGARGVHLRSAEPKSAT